MFPIAIRWQVIRNRQRGLSWESIIDHAGCSLSAAHQWWANYERHGSPWNDDAIHSRHADAAVFNASFLAALDYIVRSHPDMSLGEIEAIFRQLGELPGWDEA